MVTSAQAYAEKLTALREMMTAITIDGAQCLVFGTEDTEGSQEIRDKYYPEAVISLSWDDRGSGWSLYRYNDAPTVDFSVLEGLPGISFAHKGGFIAKTRDRVELDVVFEYVRRCIIDRCPVCGDARRDWGEGWECPGCGTI
jgi:hypothetical protein